MQERLRIEKNSLNITIHNLKYTLDVLINSRHEFKIADPQLSYDFML